MLPAAAPTGVTITAGTSLKAAAKVTVAKQPAAGLLPVLIAIVPAVSLPLTLAVPPAPRAGPFVRVGVGPAAAMCRVRFRLPLS